MLPLQKFKFHSTHFKHNEDDTGVSCCVQLALLMNRQYFFAAQI